RHGSKREKRKNRKEDCPHFSQFLCPAGNRAGLSKIGGDLRIKRQHHQQEQADVRESQVVSPLAARGGAQFLAKNWPQRGERAKKSCHLGHGGNLRRTLPAVKGLVGLGRRVFRESLTPLQFRQR